MQEHKLVSYEVFTAMKYFEVHIFFDTQDKRM